MFVSQQFVIDVQDSSSADRDTFHRQLLWRQSRRQHEQRRQWECRQRKRRSSSSARPWQFPAASEADRIESRKSEHRQLLLAQGTEEKVGNYLHESHLQHFYSTQKHQIFCKVSHCNTTIPTKLIYFSQSLYYYSTLEVCINLWQKTDSTNWEANYKQQNDGFCVGT